MNSQCLPRFWIHYESTSKLEYSKQSLVRDFHGCQCIFQVCILKRSPSACSSAGRVSSYFATFCPQGTTQATSWELNTQLSLLRVYWQFSIQRGTRLSENEISTNMSLDASKLLKNMSHPAYALPHPAHLFSRGIAICRPGWLSMWLEGSDGIDIIAPGLQWLHNAQSNIPANLQAPTNR